MTLRRWLPHSSITRFLKLGPMLVSSHSSLWPLGSLTWTRELSSCKSGSMVALLLLIGSLDSSSHRLSSLVLCRTMLERISLLLMSLISISRCTMSCKFPRSLRNQRMDVSATASTWRVPDGTPPLISLMILSPSSCILSCHSSGSCLRETESNPKLAFMCAPSIRYFLEPVPCQLLVTLPISVWILSCQLRKTKPSGFVLVLVLSLLFVTEHSFLY